MPVETLKSLVATSAKSFRNTVSVLDEADSEFKPHEGMLTVAQQVAHAARTCDWFIEGLLGGSGFDLDFEKLAAGFMGCESLEEALGIFESATARTLSKLEELEDADLRRKVPEDDPIMGGMTFETAFWYMADHTAHHRGSLAVYARLLGKTPKLPYVD